LTSQANYDIILAESEANKMKHNLLYVSCPICGKQLIDLAEGDPAYETNEHMYWCDECNVDITITESEEGE
jgi:4-hydroxy-3-methylbut-2-en-1-yl diphosphate synthase IspG/GcpE